MATISENSGDASANTRTTYTISLGDVFKGTLGTADDKDWIKVRLTAGTVYDFTLSGVDSARFELFDASGNQVVRGGVSASVAKLIFSPDVTGTYYIQAGSFEDVSPADYELSLAENTTPEGTYDEIAGYLTDGFWEWTGSSRSAFHVGPGGTLTADITALADEIQQLARWALETWTNVTGINFELVEDNNADLIFNSDPAGTASGGPVAVRNGIIISAGVNLPPEFIADHGTTIDSFSFLAIIHEIGHALGLGHPGPYPADYDNPDATYGVENIYLVDSWQVSIMSYIRQDENTWVDASIAYNVTPMIADIIAIQDLYGVPDNINAGDTVYGYGSNLDGYQGEFFRLWTGEANPFSDVDLTDDTGTPVIKSRMVDLDNDGDPDLIAGHFSGSLYYFENIGTPADPAFTERTGTDNPVDGISVGSYSTPAFADLDGDGDQDLIVGNGHGAVAYFMNTGTDSSPDFSRRTGTANPFNDITMGSWNTLTLADLDDDGDLDLATGTDDGDVRYYENTGTAASPDFTLRSGEASPLDDIDAGSDSTPEFADIDDDGDFDLVVGNRYGDIFYFENTGAAASPAFTQRTGFDNPFQGAWAGYFIAADFADLNGDGVTDLVTGSQAGIITWFKNTGTNADPVFSPQSLNSPTTFTIYDNGGNDTLDLRMDTEDQRVYLRPEGISDVYGLTGNLVIARNTLIENYIAGSGDDLVVGNAAANYIYGGDGNDRIGGSGGEDTLEGGAGADRLDGGSGMDWASYRESDSAVTVNLADNTVSGGHAEGDVLAEIENVIGSRYGDVLTGNDGANRLEGGAGADRLDGGGGDDWVSYRSSDVGVTVDLADNTFGGGHAQGDVVSNIENVTGSGHADVLTGDGSANALEGGAGDDELDGAGGADTLDGGAGNDLLYGSADADSLEGGDGFDVLSYRNSGAGVTINLSDGASTGGYAQGDVITGIERIIGSDHVDVLTGDSGPNELYGAGGADELGGNSGDDKLQGGAGADELDGGAGVDWLLYLESDAAVTVNLGDNTASGGHAQGDTIANFENIAGSGHDDVLTGDDGANRLEGRAGADRLDGGAGVDWVSYRGSEQRVIIRLIQGTGEDGDAEGDVLANFENVSGSNYNDGLVGDSGPNYLAGHGGPDGLWGYAGDDILEGGAGADRLFGGVDTDTASYQSSDEGVSVNLEDGAAAGGHAAGDTFTDIENLAGSVYPDVLVGDGGVNRLDGNEGDDELKGGKGDDELHGGEDDDRLSGQAGADTLDGGSGIDWASFEESDAGVTVNLADGTATGGDAEGDEISNVENLVGSAHADVLTGDGLANTLHGMDGDDDLRGNAGDDMLSGGAGADVLTGGAGADRLDGGAGVDVASYQNSDAGITVDLGSGTGTGGHAEGDVLRSIENVTGTDYGDHITGDNGANHLEGGGGDDTLQGGAGADRLDGGDAADWVVYWYSYVGVKVNLKDGTGQEGDAEGDVIVNIEHLMGSFYQDELTGDNGDNQLYGLDGNDMLHGNEGQDVLDGGAGADRLDGGEGADFFIFGAGHGDDTIVDFSNDEDRIDLSAFNLTGFDDLTITSEPDGAKIDLTEHGGGTILLHDFDMDNLDAADFLF